LRRKNGGAALRINAVGSMTNVVAAGGGVE
jgi:hypothetical protein